MRQVYSIDRTPGFATAAVAASLVCGACAGSPTGARSSANSPASVADGSGAMEASAIAELDWVKTGRFHSRRFELAIQLPDGGGWQIDDHRTRWLVARHPPTQSTIKLRVWMESTPVTRRQCYEQAKLWDAELPEMEIANPVADELRALGGEYPLRISTQLSPAPIPTDPAVGGVLAVAAIVRKCFVFAYETSATGLGADAVIAGRLATVSHAVIDSIRLDDAFHPPREARPDTR